MFNSLTQYLDVARKSDTLVYKKITYAGKNQEGNILWRIWFEVAMRWLPSAAQRRTDS